MENEIFTIGHSTHSVIRFIELLSKNSVNTVCDVRSYPYSKFNPQFNREPLKNELRKSNIQYVFLGKELGARSDDPKCYENGKIQFNRIAKTEIFNQGINRLIKGIESYRIALMCSERDPIKCHRTILVCRYLRSKNINIKHILEDGSIENNIDLEQRLMHILNIQQQDLFRSALEIIENAYDIQGDKIAYYKNVDDNI